MANRIARAALAGICLGSVLVAAPAHAASDMTTTMSVTMSGTTVTFNVTVCLQGKKEIYEVGLWTNQATNPACNAVPEVKWTATGVACETFTHVKTGVLPGTYTAKAFADYLCAVPELNESDNIATSVYNLKPDLTATISTLVSGTTVTHNLTVKNNGVDVTTPFKLGLFYNRTTTPTCGLVPDRTFDVLSLATGVSQPFSEVRTDVPLGSYRAYVMADVECVIAETYETNNTYSSTYYLGPNLYMYTPTVTVSGTTVTYSITVCATYSSVDVGPFSVGLWYNRTTAPTCPVTTPDFVWNETGLLKSACRTLTHVQSNATAGTWTAWVFGDKDCAIAESQETDNVRSRLYTVGTSSPPDLYLSSFTATASGSDVTYKATVCNQGSLAAGAFAVGLTYNAATGPACNATFDYTWNVTSLGAGICATLTYVRSGVAPGAYQSWALADSACAITEGTETNNLKSVGLTIGQPDLVVSSFSASVTGSQATFTAQVCNNGSAAGPFAVGIYADRTTAPDCAQTATHSLPVSSLAAGACSTVSAIESNVGAGTKQAWAFADHLCQILEGNETNNQKSYGYGIGVESPDLRVTNLTVVVGGTTVTYVVSVCNAGAAAATASDLGVYYDGTSAPECGGTPDWSVSLPGLGPGECETRTHVREGTTAGSFKAWARADAGCVVAESDETNNTSSQAYQVTTQQVDLAVTAVSILVAGDRVTTVATICNQGSGRTEPSLAGLFGDRAEAPTACLDPPDAKASVGALDPGQCTELSFVRNQVPPGEYLAWVLADTDCTLGESDETNNARSKAYTVGGSSSDASVPVDGGIGEMQVGAEPKTPPPPEDGCGCHVPVGQGGSAGLLGLALLLALLIQRRRGRR